MEENNNLTATYLSKEFTLDERITIFTVDVNDVDSINLLIQRLYVLRDIVEETVIGINR
jgi:hypothetical protein